MIIIAIMITCLLCISTTLLVLINRNLVEYRRQFIEINQINMTAFGQNFEILFNMLDEKQIEKSNMLQEQKLRANLTKTFANRNQRTK